MSGNRAGPREPARHQSEQAVKIDLEAGVKEAAHRVDRMERRAEVRLLLATLFAPCKIGSGRQKIRLPISGHHHEYTSVKSVPAPHVRKVRAVQGHVTKTTDELLRRNPSTGDGRIRTQRHQYR